MFNARKKPKENRESSEKTKQISEDVSVSRLTNDQYFVVTLFENLSNFWSVCRAQKKHNNKKHSTGKCISAFNNSLIIN